MPQGPGTADRPSLNTSVQMLHTLPGDVRSCLLQAARLCSPTAGFLPKGGSVGTGLFRPPLTGHSGVYDSLIEGVRPQDSAGLHHDHCLSSLSCCRLCATLNAAEIKQPCPDVSFHEGNASTGWQLMNGDSSAASRCPPLLQVVVSCCSQGLCCCLAA